MNLCNFLALVDYPELIISTRVAVVSNFGPTYNLLSGAPDDTYPQWRKTHR